MNSPADAAQALASIIACVSEGELTPAEAGELCKLVDGFVHAIETVELEARVAALEQTQR